MIRYTYDQSGKVKRFVNLTDNRDYTIDINDKNIPAYLRKTKKSEVVQSSIHEYELKK